MSADWETKDWVRRLFRSRAFAKIPAEKINAVLKQMESMPVAAGETILREGEIADAYYIIQQGKCRIVDRESVLDATKEVATLGPGDSFGEEGLIRDSARSATIEMLTDGRLVRLGKTDFVELVQKPLLEGLSIDHATLKAQTGAEWVDVRSMSGYAEASIPGSLSIPMKYLRASLDRLSQDKTYIVCSDDPAEAALGAFILCSKDFEAGYLEDNVLAYLKATGLAGDIKHLFDPTTDEGVIELPEEYATATGAFIKEDDDDGGHPAESTPRARRQGTTAEAEAPADEGDFFQQLREQIDAHVAAQCQRAAQDAEARIQAVTADYEARLEKQAQQLKAKYQAYYEDKMQKLKQRYQQVLAEHTGGEKPAG